MEMFENVEVLVQKIGSQLVEIEPEHWEKIVLGAFIDDHTQALNIRIFVKDKKTKEYSNILKEAYDTGKYIVECGNIQYLCRDLHAAYEKLGTNWTSFTYILHSDLTFEIKNGFEPLDLVHSDVEKKWQNTYLK